MKIEKDCKVCYFNKRGMCLINEAFIHCERFTRRCDECGSKAEYVYGEKAYCTDCMLEHFDVEESKITHYYFDGMYIGSSEELDDIMRNLSEGIEEIE